MNNKNKIVSLAYQLATIIIQFNVIFIFKYLYLYLLLGIRMKKIIQII